MAFCVKYLVPSKICLNSKILERVNYFTYLGFTLSFLDEIDISQKITRYNKTMGIINNIIKPSLVQKHTRIRLYKTLARPVLCYGSEAWTLRKKDESRITANEMKFMRYTAGYTKWDHKHNEDVLEELQVEPVIEYIRSYQNNWLEHLHRMHRNRNPKVMLHYRPHGKRSLGRPRKRWTE